MNLKMNLKKSDIFAILGSGLFTAALWVLGSNFTQFKAHDFLSLDVFYRFFSVVHLKSFILFFLLGCFLALLLKKYGSSIGNFLYKYRYLCALLVVILAVLLQISGSSIACLTHMVDVDAKEPGLLFGIPRMMRSDEFGVNTPMAFSQAHALPDAFPYFSNILRGTSTDMFVVYGQPVWSLATIFRPFLWGYLLLGAVRGLSFFWVVRWVALFMVSFEFGMLLTNKNKLLALAFGILTIFAPAVQWWFAINGLVEMLFFVQLSWLFIYYYLTSPNYKIRCLLALALIICAGGFALVFYPAWQIPMGYILVAGIIAIIWQYRDKIIFSAKKDLPIIILSFLFLAIAGVLIFYRSMDSILATMHTVYPGKTVVSKNGTLRDLFLYFLNILSPYLGDEYISNSVEFSCFFSFFPLGIIFALVHLIKAKKKDPWVIVLLTCDLCFLIYFLVPWPMWLKTLTLLKYSATGRILVPLSWLNLLLLFRSVLFIKNPKRYLNIFIAVIVAALVFLFFKDESFFNIALVLVISLICILGALLFVNMQRSKKIAKYICVYSCILGVIIGGLINPVQSGAAGIYDLPIMQDMESIAKQEPDQKWIVEGCPFPLNNLPTMAGCPTINSTNTYPNFEFWTKLDPKKEHEEIYNRYIANFQIFLQKDKATSCYLVNNDALILYLNPKDLQKIGVSYILTNNNLQPFNSKNVKFKLVYQENNCKIYHVIY